MDIISASGRVVGNVSTEMHYVSLFLLKIYYKKTQLGEGHLPLCAKGWGRGSRGRQQLKGEPRASLPGALAHHFQVVLLQLGSKQGVLVLQLLNLLPQELIIHLQPLCLLEGLLHALVGLA